jgi:hypothetical protein
VKHMTLEKQKSIEPFTVCVAECRGNKSNTVYPQRVHVTDLHTLQLVCELDHVCAEYKGGHRSEKDFIFADCLPMDCDNAPSNDKAPDLPSEQWKTPADVQAVFPGVRFCSVTSRNHMKPKDGKPERPRHHYYFPINAITDAKEYAAMKRKMREIFPSFDENALDAARFFFGNEQPEVEFFDGEINLTEFMNSLPDGKPEAVQPLAGLQKKSDPTSKPTEGMPPLTGLQKKSDPNPKLGEGTPPKSRKNVIHEGERNSTLSRRAGQLLKRYGDTDDTRRRYNEVCERCDPRLDVSEENTIYLSAQRFFHTVIEQSPTYKPADLYGAPPFAIPTDKGYVISPPLLADYYLEHHTVIIETNSGNPRVYEYDGGAYIYRTELEVKAALGAYITAFRRGMWQSGKVAEAYTAIIHTSGLYITQGQLNANPDIVCLKNGLLNLKEWRLYPHSPDAYYTTQLDCEFTDRIPETPVFDKDRKSVV